MSSSGCRPSGQTAQVSATASAKNPADRLDETEFSKGNDCHNFHKLPKELSTRNQWPDRMSTVLPPRAISARHKTETLASLRTRAHHMRQRSCLSSVLFMSSLIAQLFSTNFAIRTNTWHRETTQMDSGRQTDQLTWSSQSNFAPIGSESIPSARYVYTYPNESRKRVRTPTSSTWNGDRIRHLHDQLNQLKRELDHELGRSPQETEASDSIEVMTTQGESANVPPLASRIELGSPCFSTKFCQISIKNSQCNLDRFTCECLNEHVKLNSTTCLAPALLGFECQLDDQCRRRVSDSVCRDGKCSCSSDNFLAYKRNKCLRASKINDYCLLDGQCQLNDKHSFCRWKIQNVYGTCKCPPNYKLMPGQGSELRCAPRLGDSCLNDLECRLATENSVCRSSELPLINRRWTSSNASNMSCTCETGFRWSDDMLKCQKLVSEAPNLINVTSVGTLQMQQASVTAAEKQQDSHKYELLDMNSTTTSNIETVDKRNNANASFHEELEIKLIPMDSRVKTSTKPTTTTTITQRPAQNESLSRQDPTTKFRMVSLGKACKWRQECQARDPNSDCIDGICECLVPSAKCRASTRGCHPNTFQCRSGQCISWYFVCDQFRNCDDGSDEDECKPGLCPPEAFQCRADGQCLTRGRVCDGQRDCSDGSDEFGCGLSRAGANNNGTGADCPAGSFACADGQCLPGFVFCNAVEDCADGSDEDELICERTSSLTLAFDRNQAASASTASQTPVLNLEQTRNRPLRRNETNETESPLVKTDRASIERLMASLGLGGAKWRQRPFSTGATSTRTSRRSRLMKSRGLEERRRPGQAMARRQFLVKNQRHGQGAEVASLECPASAFTCRNGKCRSSAILCSGIDGCGDNSDEDHCEVCQCELPQASPSRTPNSRRHSAWLT